MEAAMSAHTQTGSHPKARAGVDIRLPWWALALPMLAFVVLLLLIADPAQAQATDGEPAVGQILERIQHSLSR
jgi:type VI protein secretion system component VasF